MGSTLHVVVLGMHRSGMSAITRALQLFHVDLGALPYGEVLGDNDSGFSQDIDPNSLSNNLPAKRGH